MQGANEKPMTDQKKKNKTVSSIDELIVVTYRIWVKGHVHTGSWMTQSQGHHWQTPLQHG